MASTGAKFTVGIRGSRRVVLMGIETRANLVKNQMPS